MLPKKENQQPIAALYQNKHNLNETAAGQEQAPLLEAMLEYNKQNYLPFHVPGHLKGAGSARQLQQLWGTSIFKYDLTELPGLDDLHQPTQAIYQAEKLAAELFGSQQTYFLINGTSCGLLAALLSLPRGSKIALPRNSHAALYHGLELAGLQPVYLQPDWSQRFMLPTAVLLDSYRQVLAAHDLAAAVAINPSYYGIAPPIKEIAALTAAYGVPLLVDEAHGSHFCLNDRFPVPALAAGAEVAVQSLHKTGGSLTQTSLLQHNCRLLAAAKLRRNLDILQTTSPSYILLASLDCARREMALRGRQMWGRILDLAANLRQEIAAIPGIDLLEETDLPDGCALDPTKIVLNCRRLGLSGWQVRDLLRIKYKIEPELADDHNVLLYLTYATSEQQLQQLLDALRDLTGQQVLYQAAGACFGARPAAGQNNQAADQQPNKLLQQVLAQAPPLCLLPTEAREKTSETIALEEACGRISAEMLVPYPPGIPVVCPGEKITFHIWRYLLELRSSPGLLHGAADSSLRTVQVIAAEQAGVEQV